MNESFCCSASLSAFEIGQFSKNVFPSNEYVVLITSKMKVLFARQDVSSEESQAECSNKAFPINECQSPEALDLQCEQVMEAHGHSQTGPQSNPFSVKQWLCFF